MEVEEEKGAERKEETVGLRKQERLEKLKKEEQIGQLHEMCGELRYTKFPFEPRRQILLWHVDRQS